MNAGLPNEGEGFTTVKSGGRRVVQFQEGSEWLVCQWWFQVPQLFWVVDYGTGAAVKVPSGCALVELVVEWI